MKSYSKLLVVLSLGGVLFSGYLSAYKFFNKACALSESCPYFLGYPACYFGFLMFLTLFIASSIAVYNKGKNLWPLKIVLGVSALGILFAGSFVVEEISNFFQAENFKGYALGLPTCAWGLIFYILVFIFSLRELNLRRKSEEVRV